MQAYTVEQVAEMLHVGRDKVYYLLRTGQLHSLKIGKLRRITEQQLAEIKAGIHTPATYTVRQCVVDWLDSLTLDPVTVSEYRGQAEKWIYPKIGATKLKDFRAADADRFFKELGKVLGKRSPMMIKSTLRRSIRRRRCRISSARTWPSSSTCRPASRGVRLAR